MQLNGRHNEEEQGKKKKDSSVQSVGKIKREIRSVKRLLSRVEVFKFPLLSGIDSFNWKKRDLAFFRV